ncbi:MAG: alkaline phosphatase family protein [Chloroflexi bacterium]|nr:alkaline phosphatase family protein [Chloroflexota bacterium]
MLNTHTLDGFVPLGEYLRRPRYDGYSFGAIPATVTALLTGERAGSLLPADCFGGAYPTPRKVVVLLIDSFGWAFWERAWQQWPALRRITERGVVTPISALFPTTTSASITTMNYGVPPAQHALAEWNLYIDAYGEVIQTLPFTALGHPPAELKAARGFDPRHLVTPRATLYQRLAARGVPSLVFSRRGYAFSPYNSMATAGAEVVPYSTLAEGLLALRTRLEAADGPTYLYYYWPDIDAIGHTHGPGTRAHELEVANFWLTFAAVFDGWRPDDETLFLFTADHGQVYGDPAATIALNQALPELAGALRRAPNGRPIRPCGAPRDVLLHLQPGAAPAIADRLRALLDGIAEVLTTEAALALGLFGPPPYDPEFRRRLGDLLILPAAGRYVWWHEPEDYVNVFFGHHGGLAADEVTSVLAATHEL